MQIIVGPRAWHKLPLSPRCPATWGKLSLVGEEVEASPELIDQLAQRDIWPCRRCN